MLVVVVFYLIFTLLQVGASFFVVQNLFCVKVPMLVRARIPDFSFTD